jgi:hypothetical protein
LSRMAAGGATLTRKANPAGCVEERYGVNSGRHRPGDG